MKITLYIGYWNHCVTTNDAVRLDANLPPTFQIDTLREYLLQGETDFYSNSNYVLMYFTCLLQASRLEYPICSKYPVRIESVTVYTVQPDGTHSLLDNYKGLPSDENLLNDAITKTNDDFSDLLDYEDKIKKTG